MYIVQQRFCIQINDKLLGGRRVCSQSASPWPPCLHAVQIYKYTNIYIFIYEHTKIQINFVDCLYKDSISQAREQCDDPGQCAGDVPPPRRLRLPPHHVLLLWLHAGHPPNHQHQVIDPQNNTDWAKHSQLAFRKQKLQSEKLREKSENWPIWLPAPSCGK